MGLVERQSALGEACVRVCALLIILIWSEILFGIMEMFSLEEEDNVNEIMLTQHSQNVVSILGNLMDFKSPCVGLTSQPHGGQQIYEDISDDDFFKIPCSQQVSSQATDYRGCILKVLSLMKCL